MKKDPLNKLRMQLLEVNGIGPETADSILLYALNEPIFVIDMYTKRFLSKHNLVKKGIAYDHLQKIFMDNLPRNRKLFNEYHALIVKLAKKVCKKKPNCGICPLYGIMP